VQTIGRSGAQLQRFVGKAPKGPLGAFGASPNRRTRAPRPAPPGPALRGFEPVSWIDRAPSSRGNTVAGVTTPTGTLRGSAPRSASCPMESPMTSPTPPPFENFFVLPFGRPTVPQGR